MMLYSYTENILNSGGKVIMLILFDNMEVVTPCGDYLQKINGKLFHVISFAFIENGNSTQWI